MTTIRNELDLARVATGKAAAGVTCAHCDLPVLRGLVVPEDQNQFCCDGCRTVFGIVRVNGLESYYPMRRELEDSRARAHAMADDFAAFDDPAYLDRYVTTHPDGTATTTLLLEGVHCAACVWLVEKLPRVVPGEGVLESSMSFARSTVRVRFDPARSTLSAAARGLDSLGYRPHPPRGADEVRANETRRQLARLGVAGALAGNVMLLAIALYAGMLDGITPAVHHSLRAYSAALGVLALAWPGRVFFTGAYAAIRTRSPHLDIPVALALLVGGAWGTLNTVRGVGEIYFDSLTILVFLLLVGRFVQHRQQRRAADAVELLLTLTPSTVRLVRGEEVVTRPIHAAQVGDIAEVLAGQTIPTDGEVLTGVSRVDNALLTGESAPASVVVGDAVFAGATNLNSPIRVRITAAGEQTRIGQLVRLVAEASALKPELVQFADRVAGRFVIVVSLLAVGTGVLWAFIDPSHAVEHATALLIVTCPCALGLATPLVFSATLGRLAKRGVLVKGGSALERLAHAGRVFVDKTGTLTTGSLQLRGWVGPESLQPLVAAIESGATHPIARVLAESLHAANPSSGDGHRAEAIEQIDGLGVVGSVGGRRLVVGSDKLMASREIRVPEDFRAWAKAQAECGSTPVMIAESGVVVAGASVSGDLRPEAPAMVGRLEAMGLGVSMLTGDRAEAAAAVADRVGIAPERVLASATPESKLAQIGKAQNKRGASGGVVMVGDGVNDAGALAAADVGIAVAGGAEASMQAADMYVKDQSLLAIPLAISAARGAVRRVRVCLVVSLAYNAVAASLAIAGLIHPLLAAVLMPASSLTVLAIAAARPAWDSSTRHGVTEGQR